MTVKDTAHQATGDDHLRVAVRHALSGNAILFLGAGAAKAAKNPGGTPLPTGQELSDAMAFECNLGPGYSLDTIAQHFLDVRSESALIDALRRHLTVSSVGSVLTALASIPWSRIWTTNYDDSFERALNETKVSHYSFL